MQAQYVYAAHDALYRVVRHGHRWRALRADEELGRFDTADDAVLGLRASHGPSKLPRSLKAWRYLQAGALAHLPPPTQSTMTRLAKVA